MDLPSQVQALAPGVLVIGAQLPRHPRHLHRQPSLALGHQAQTGQQHILSYFHLLGNPRPSAVLSLVHVGPEQGCLPVSAFDGSKSVTYPPTHGQTAMNEQPFGCLDFNLIIYSFHIFGALFRFST